MQFQCQTIAVLAERHLAGDPGAQDDLRVACRYLLGERLGGVAGDVEDGLDELLAVAAELGDRGVVVAQGRQAARELGRISARTRSQTSWMLTLPTTWGFRCGASRRSTSSCSRSASLMMTWVYSVERARLDLHLEQLRRAADAAERVLDLVGEIADQLLVACACSSARSSRSWRVCCSISTISKTTLREPSIWLTITCTGSDSPWPGRLQRLEAARREGVVADRRDRVAQHLRVGEPVEERAAQHAAPRQAEHVLERGVGEHAFAFGRDHGDHRRQQVERGLRGRLARRAPAAVAPARSQRQRGGSFWSSRWRAAMSLSLRAIAARIWATRSRYFW